MQDQRNPYKQSKTQLMTEESQFDFETLIPTPDGLKDTAAPFRGTEEESTDLKERIWL